MIFILKFAHRQTDAYTNGMIGMEARSQIIVSTHIPVQGDAIDIGVGGMRRSLQNPPPFAEGLRGVLNSFA